MKKVDAAYEKAKAYVDEQLGTDRRSRKLAKMTKEQYAQLVRRIARVTPRISENGVAAKNR